jgi:NTE family protein
MTRFFSPTQLNPLDINPLRDILLEQVDFERLRRQRELKLFIAATQVSTGTLKIFRNADLSVEVLLASACLPSLHRPIEIDGEAYWDGGLTANPPIFPLAFLCRARRDGGAAASQSPRRHAHLQPRHRPAALGDQLQLGLLHRTERTGPGQARGREFHPGLRSLERRLRQLNIHMIDANELMEQLTNLSKLNTQASFIGSLFQQGGSAPPNGWSRTSPRSAIHPPSTWDVPALNRRIRASRTIVHFCLYFAA